jgi:hypothetical protein
MMKRNIFTLISLFLLIASPVFGAQGDIVPISTNVLWQVSATLNMNNASNPLLSAMDGMSVGYASHASMSEFAPWLKIELAQSGSMGKEFPNSIYNALIAMIIGYEYGVPSVDPQYLPPVCALDGSDIDCDEDPTGQDRNVLIFLWDFSNFTEGAAGSLAGGVWTFSGLSAATNYVCAYADWKTVGSLNTRYITTP